MLYTFHAIFQALRSLLLAALFSFILPLVLLGGAWTGASLIRQIPDIAWLGRICIHGVNTLLAVFGSGDMFEGLLVIGLSFGLVGVLFDGFTLYRQRQYHDMNQDYNGVMSSHIE